MKFTLRSLARRIIALETEILDLDRQLRPLVTATAPTLSAIYGVGLDVAATLLVAAGDNPDRLGSAAAFAHLCGAAPIPASSGKTQRHRLNRGGNRQANHALWVTAMVRLRHDQRTKNYRDRRTTEGKSSREIVRCLKTYISREIYRAIITDLAPRPVPSNPTWKPLDFHRSIADRGTRTGELVSRAGSRAQASRDRVRRRRCPRTAARRPGRRRGR